MRLRASARRPIEAQEAGRSPKKAKLSKLRLSTGPQFLQESKLRMQSSGLNSYCDYYSGLRVLGGSLHLRNQMNNQWKLAWKLDVYMVSEMIANIMDNPVVPLK